MESVDTIRIALGVSIAIIMLGMGLSLTISDFKRISENPKGVLIGLFNQLILLPIIAYLLVFVFNLNGSLAVGLMLIAACPGGATSNLITNLAKGDLGLSVTLTAFSSMITVFTIPLIVNFSLGNFMGEEGEISLSFFYSFKQIVLLTVVPVVIGMFIRTRSVQFADKMEKPVKIASAVLMAIIIAGAVAKNKDVLAAAIPTIGPAVIALNIITMVIGFFIGNVLNLDLRQKICISIESGIQNGTLALFVGSLGVMANYSEILLAPALYSILMFFTGAIFAYLSARMVNKSVRKNNL